MHDGRCVCLPGETMEARRASAVDLIARTRSPLGGPKAVWPPELTDPGLHSAKRSRSSIFTCRFPDCGKEFTTYSGMNSHVKRKHGKWLQDRPGGLSQCYDELRDAPISELERLSRECVRRKGNRRGSVPAESAPTAAPASASRKQPRGGDAPAAARKRPSPAAAEPAAAARKVDDD